MVRPASVSGFVQERSADDAALATVIDLPQRRAQGRVGSGPPGQLTVGTELAAPSGVLHRGSRDGWREHSEALGRPLAPAEAVFATSPIATPPSTPAPEAIARATAALRPAAALVELVQDEGEVLEQALSASLVDLDLRRISAVVDAVLRLGAAPQAVPAWASPAEARAADVVLDAHSSELRKGGRLHRAVYAQFTERIWDVPATRLKRGRRPRRLISWLRLRRSFTLASRTLRAPSPLTDAADLVLEAGAGRRRILAMAPLLETHLGELARGPLTDVDAARVALDAVRALQAALGDRLDPERLAALLTAEAFRDDIVLGPARILQTAFRTWTADVARLGGGDALGTRAADLARWALVAEETLPVLKRAEAAVGHPGTPAVTVGDLVHDLLAHEHFSELTIANAEGAS